MRDKMVNILDLNVSISLSGNKSEMEKSASCYPGVWHDQSAIFKVTVKRDVFPPQYSVVFLRPIW